MSDLMPCCDAQVDTVLLCKGRPTVYGTRATEVHQRALATARQRAQAFLKLHGDAAVRIAEEQSLRMAALRDEEAEH